jgi:hypothetical protein
VHSRLERLPQFQLPRTPNPLVSRPARALPASREPLALLLRTDIDDYYVKNADAYFTKLPRGYSYEEQPRSPPQPASSLPSKHDIFM